MRKDRLARVAAFVAAFQVFTAYADSLGAVVCVGAEGQIEVEEAHGHDVGSTMSVAQPLALCTPDDCCYVGHQVQAVVPPICRLRQERAPAVVAEGMSCRGLVALVARGPVAATARAGPPGALSALRTVQILI